jgi:long-subunit fatty acid transport protein
MQSNNNKVITRSLVFIIATSSSLNALAGGLEVGDQGARASGRAGAFVAKADDPSAIEYNPAGLANMEGWEIYMGNRFGYANEQFTRAPTWDWSEAHTGLPVYVTFDKVENEKPWQLLGPMVVLASDFGLKNWGFAVGAYGPPGISTQKYPLDGGQRYMLTERDTKILYYNVSAAWKYNDLFGLGFSLQWVDATRLKIGLVVNGDNTPGVVEPDHSAYDMKAEIEGADHIGISGIFGAWWRPRPYLQLAFSGRVIPVNVNADCKLSLEALELNLEEPLTPTRDGVPDNDVTFSMTLPIQLRLGGRYIHLKGGKELFDVELDVRYEMWSQMDKYVIDGKGLVIELANQVVEVGEIVVRKNWQDTFSVRLGGDYNVIQDRLALRAGGFFESAAEKEEFAYVDFFASHRLGGSAGASLMFGGFDLSLSYTYVFEWPFAVSEKDGKIYQQAPGSPCEAPYTDPLSCNEHYYGQPSATANAGTYVSNYHFASISASYGF